MKEKHLRGFPKQRTLIILRQVHNINLEIQEREIHRNKLLEPLYQDYGRNEVDYLYTLIEHEA